MGAVHVRIGHNDDLMVSQLGNIKVLVDPGSKGRDSWNGSLCISVDPVQSCLLHV